MIPMPHDAPPADNAAALRAAAEVFVLAESHDREELLLFEELCGALLERAETADRLHVARLLARRADCPALVARKLARDRIEVAEPFLLASPALSTVDLLAIVATRSEAHRRMVALRGGLAPEVVAALFRSGDRETLTLLLADLALKLPQGAIDLLPGLLRREPRLAPALAARPDVPKSLFLDLDPFLALPRLSRGAVLRAASLDGVTAALGRRPGADSAVAERLQALAFERALEDFAAELAAAARIGPQIAAKIAGDPGGEALGLALRAIGLPTLAAMPILIHASADVGRSYAALIGVADLLDEIGTDAAQAVLARWGAVAPRRPAAEGTVVAASERPRRTEPRPVERRGEERSRAAREAG